MSNRKQLLEASLTEDKNVTTIVATTLAKDVKFLKRTKRDLEDEIEDAEDALKLRLSSNSIIDSSTVLVTYGKIKELKEQLELYKSFETTYITDEK